MEYSNIDKIISIENHSNIYVDENDQFQSKDPLDEVNKYLSEGWILLSIDSVPNDDHTSRIQQYVLGHLKSNPSK